MKQIFIKKINDSYYADAVAKPEDLRLETIAEWFTDDVGTRSERWKKWINNSEPALDSVSSNASSLVKYEGNIIISSQYAGHGLEGYYEIPSKYTVLISPDNLVEILDTWQMMLEIRPNKIVITEENGNYKMFASQ